MPYSISHTLKELAKALDPEHYEVSVEGIAPEHMAELPSRLLLPNFGRVDIQVNFSYPPSFCFKSNARQRIEILCWETTFCPEAWALQAQEVDHVITPSRFSREALMRGGFPEDRVSVMPLGVDSDLFNPDGEKIDRQSRWAVSDDTTVFFHMGALDERKGTRELLTAYAEAFTAEDRVLLIVKNNSFATFFRVNDLWHEILATNGRLSPPRLIAQSGEFPPSELAKLMRSVDVGVFPYKAEGGFGLVPLELMASGTPIIFSAFGAVPEYGEGFYNFRISGERVPSQFSSDHHREHPNAKWLNVDHEKLVASLRWLNPIPKFDSPSWSERKEWCRAKAREYTWAKTAVRFSEIVR